MSWNVMINSFCLLFRKLEAIIELLSEKHDGAIRESDLRSEFFKLVGEFKLKL